MADIVVHNAAGTDQRGGLVQLVETGGTMAELIVADHVTETAATVLLTYHSAVQLMTALGHFCATA